MKINVFVAAACAVLLLPVAVLAADPAPAKADPAKAGPVKAEASAPQPNDSAVDIDEATGKPKRRQPRSRRSQREAVAPAASPYEAECAWVGKRATGLLKRDDVEAARQFESFYSAFGCPIEHLGKAFGCVVSSESATETVDARIDRCWAGSYVRGPAGKDGAGGKASPEGASSQVRSNKDRDAAKPAAPGAKKQP